MTHDQDEALSLADRIVVMKDGVVQQIAAPQDVYAQPANLHVARFMGYRNVLELDVEREDGRPRRRWPAPDIRLTGMRKQPLTAGAAAVAIRPEEIVVGDGAGRPNTIAGRVDNVEYCGRDSLVDVVHGVGHAAARARAGRAAPRRHVRVHVPVERVLVYPAGMSLPSRRAMRTAGRRARPLRRSTARCCWWCRRAAFMLLLFVYPFLYGLVLSFKPTEGRRARATTRTSSRPTTSGRRSGPRCGSRCRRR